MINKTPQLISVSICLAFLCLERCIWKKKCRAAEMSCCWVNEQQMLIQEDVWDTRAPCEVVAFKREGFSISIQCFPIFVTRQIRREQQMKFVICSADQQGLFRVSPYCKNMILLPDMAPNRAAHLGYQLASSPQSSSLLPPHAQSVVMPLDLQLTTEVSAGLSD